jgi:hypothetical protein
MLGHAAFARALLVAAVSLLLQAHKKPHIRLPGSKVRLGMPCPVPGCTGHVILKNSIYQCTRCYSIIEPV